MRAFIIKMGVTAITNNCLILSYLRYKSDNLVISNLNILREIYSYNTYYISSR